MSFDETNRLLVIEKIKEVLPVVSQNLSQILNLISDVKFEADSAVHMSQDSFQVDEMSIGVVADFSNGAELGVFARTEDAVLIADLMAGGKGDDPSKPFEAIEQAAFSEAVGQSVSAMLHVLSQSGIGGFDMGELSHSLLDPNDDTTLARAINAKEYISFALRINIKNVIDSIFFVDLSVDLANAIIGSDPENNSNVSQANNYFNVDFAQMQSTFEPNDENEKRNLNLLLDIKMGLIVELGRAEMTLRDILKLTRGSVIELDRLSGEPVDLFVNNKIVARGEVVVIDDSFGLRITQLASNLEQLV